MSNILMCYDRLGCLLNVFEHELLHFVVGIRHGHVKGDPIYKSHRLYFQQLMLAYFGHTEFKHALNKTIYNPGKREDFNLGDYVTYNSKTGNVVTGIIIKLNPKRITIANSTIPYIMLRPSTKDEIARYEAVKDLAQPMTIVNTKFSVGDIVSYTTTVETKTGQIRQINPKTYYIGQYKVAHSIVR